MSLYKTGERVEVYDTTRQAWMGGNVTGATVWTVHVSLDDRMTGATVDPGDSHQIRSELLEQAGAA